MSVRDLYVGITLNDRASRQLDKIDRKVDDVRDEFADLGNEVDRAGNAINRMGSGFKDFAKQSGKIGAITSGFSGLIAAAGPAVVGIGAVGASFAAAGIGAAAFGAVAVSALGQVFEASEEVEKIEEKIANADTAKERIAAQKELAAVYGDMSQAQRGALKELQGFKSFWSGFVKQFETPVFNAFGESLTLARNVFTGLAPTITNVGDAVNVLLSEMNAGIEAGGLKNFFGWLESNAADALYNFSHILGNTLAGVWNMLAAFSPVGAEVEEGLLSMTERFKTWSASLSSSNGFQKFIDYARTNGPVLMDTLGNIGTVIGKVVKSLAPLGQAVLQAANEFTNFVSTSSTIQGILDGFSSLGTTIQENWGAVKETVIALTSAFVAYKVAMAGMAIIGTVNTLMASYRAVAGTMTVAQWALNVAMTANPIGLIIVGIAALIGIGVALYRNWDVIKAKAGELWSWMKEKWNGIKQSTTETWNSLKTTVSTKMEQAKAAVIAKLAPLGQWMVNTWNKVKTSTSNTWNGIKTTISNAMNNAKSAVSNFFSPLLSFINRAKSAWSSFKSAISNFKMPSFKMPSLPKLPGFATGLANVPYDDMPVRVHKEESILTAKQSNALRDAGMLKSNASGRPVLDFDSAPAPVATTTTNTSNVAPVFNITVNAPSGDGPSIARAVEDVVESLFLRANLRRGW